MSYEIENEFGKAYKFNKESDFPKERAEKFLSDSVDNETIYFENGYHRFMGWTFVPNGYETFLVKFAYSIENDFEYRIVHAKNLERANNLFTVKYEDIEIFTIIPEPTAFANCFKAEEDVKNRFTVIDFIDEDHLKDLNESLAKNEIECLVDETQGGIIAYYLKGNQGLILENMNK